MKDNSGKTPGKRLGDFLAGKGFYIVLAVCIVIIGASAWAIFLTGEQPSVADIDAYVPVLNPSPSSAPKSELPAFNVEVKTPPPLPSPSAEPSPSPTPKAAPKPTATPKPDDGHGDDASAAKIEDVQFVKPVSGTVGKQFSLDALQYSRTLGDWRAHDGIDYNAPPGTKVVAIADGTVRELYADDMLGTVVVIDHGFGLLASYANLQAVPVVAVGDKVSLGSVIGSVGETSLAEASDPTHLHLSMTKDGSPVNPADYVG
ncbi:MAG: M23 family metallopeptidase [Oscillospiraceae bacterium]|jgi:murein DD-endopeptidase MepM/ murein hydrolase activator NlpD|nr:M23 family metallopeptidase [Oscillospiraceae bacterium]